MNGCADGNVADFVLYGDTFRWIAGQGTMPLEHFRKLILQTCPFSCGSCVVFVPECLPGTYRDGTGFPYKYSCRGCLPGRYTATHNVSGECQSAPPGFYMSGHNLTQPSLCPPGSVSSTSGSVNCTVCQQGTFKREIDASACALCPKGQGCFGPVRSSKNPVLNIRSGPVLVKKPIRSGPVLVLL